MANGASALRENTDRLAVRFLRNEFAVETELFKIKQYQKLAIYSTL